MPAAVIFSNKNAQQSLRHFASCLVNINWKLFSKCKAVDAEAIHLPNDDAHTVLWIQLTVFSNAITKTVNRRNESQMRTQLHQKIVYFQLFLWPQHQNFINIVYNLYLLLFFVFFFFCLFASFLFCFYLFLFVSAKDSFCFWFLVIFSSLLFP